MRPPSELKIDRARAALLVVDVQERLCAAMDGAALAATERNLRILIELARRLELPVVQSEQYPVGLGRTIASIAAALDAPDLRRHRLEKVEFSAACAPAFEPIWNELGRDQWIVAGMETHVCVYQSVRDLAGRGAAVHVPLDAVISRTPQNHQVGLSLIEKAGGIVTSTEVVVFDALHRAASEDFRAMSKLMK